jgi:hypothetical protein
MTRLSRGRVSSLLVFVTITIVLLEVVVVVLIELLLVGSNFNGVSQTVRWDGTFCRHTSEFLFMSAFFLTTLPSIPEAKYLPVFIIATDSRVGRV